MKDDVRLAKWLEGEMDEKELQEFEASPGYATYSKIKEYSAQLSVPDTDMDAVYQSIQLKKQGVKKIVPVRKLTPWLPRVAAILILFLGLGWVFYSTHTTTQVAQAGTHDTFALPDGSQVVLNAGSEVEYKNWNWNNNREVNLHGEAWFKVAKGKTFDVVTPLGTVTVVGTQFNVRERGNRFEVTCYEGKVNVTVNNNTTLLTPGKSLFFENGKALALPDMKGQQPGWVTHNTYFSRENLENVLKEMERQYNVIFVLNEKAHNNVLNNPYSGPLPMNDLESALETIEPIYHLKAKKEGDRIILTSE